MEFIYEFLFEIYLELMMLIIPNEKATSKRYKIIITFIALFILLLVLALIICGLVLLIDKNSFWGVIPLGLGIILSLIQIILGFVFYNKGHSQE